MHADPRTKPRSLRWPLRPYRYGVLPTASRSIRLLSRSRNAKAVAKNFGQLLTDRHVARNLEGRWTGKRVAKTSSHIRQAEELPKTCLLNRQTHFPKYRTDSQFTEGFILHLTDMLPQTSTYDGQTDRSPRFSEGMSVPCPSLRNPAATDNRDG